VLSEVRLDQLVECEPTRDARLSSKPLELALERVTRVGLQGEPAPLNAPERIVTRQRRKS